MEALKDYILANPIFKREQIAAAIGCNKVAFSQWMTGKKPLPEKYEDKLREVLAQYGYKN